MIRPLAILAGLALSVALWRFWSSICNESCSPARALSMQFLCIALPLSAVFSVFTAVARRPSRSRRMVSWFLLTALLIWAACVSLLR
ncbi:hypothetical protein DBR42_15015 [Pelomonas sp. HMWF004]|nr:hypothetical protein DBR42_15015 [Pelomonas sp. HMWF004]